MSLLGSQWQNTLTKYLSDSQFAALSNNEQTSFINRKLIESNPIFKGFVLTKEQHDANSQSQGNDVSTSVVGGRGSDFGLSRAERPEGYTNFGRLAKNDGEPLVSETISNRSERSGLARVIDSQGKSHGPDGKYDGGLGIPGLVNAPQTHVIPTIQGKVTITTHGTRSRPNKPTNGANTGL